MDIDAINEIITILMCYKNNFELASSHDVPKQFYEDSIKNMFTQIESVLENAE